MTIIVAEKRFAGEQHDIRDFVTPAQIEVVCLFEQLKSDDPQQTLLNCWTWVNDNVAYPTDRLGRTVDRQELISFGALHYINSTDFWFFPCEVIARARIARKYGRKSLGDCDDVAFVLVSVLRNQLSPQDVYCVMGDYFNSQAAGHAWVKCRLDGAWCIVDPTAKVGTPADPNRYDEFVLFNDMEVHELKPVEGLLGSIARGI